MKIIDEDNKEYKAALYIRLSKEDGDKEESESVVNQRKILEEYAKENNYDVYDEYVDDGFSGTNFNRPDFKRMIEDIENKKVNMVITKSLSRLGRDYIETGRLIETYFPENEIRYIAILDDVDTYLDKNSDFVAFRNIMNDYYAKETSKNIKKTKNKKKKEGFYYITYAPFGYRKTSISGELEIDEVQAVIVQRIFNLFLEGNGTYRIARILTEDKIDIPGVQMNMTNIINIENTAWNHNTIRRILTNKIYIGDCIQNKTKKISYKSKKIIMIPEEEQTINKNHHKAIISKEKWELVQRMLKNSKGAKIKSTDVIFKNLLYCSHCKNKLLIRTKTNHNKKGDVIKKYILCSNPNTSCYSRYINYSSFETKAFLKVAEVLDIYMNSKIFNKEEVLNNIYRFQKNKESYLSKVDRLNKDLEKNKKKIKILYHDKLNGLLEEFDFEIFKEELINEKLKIEKHLKEVEYEISKDNLTISQIDEEVQIVLNRLCNDKKFNKKIISQLINKIEIDREKNVVIHFNFQKPIFIGV